MFVFKCLYYLVCQKMLIFQMSISSVGKYFKYLRDCRRHSLLKYNTHFVFRPLNLISETFSLNWRRNSQKLIYALEIHSKKYCMRFDDMNHAGHIALEQINKKKKTLNCFSHKFYLIFSKVLNVQ